MRYTLMPYQETASEQIMSRLQEAMDYPDRQSVFALCAPTGAGKTVIATSVFERLLLPSDDYVPDEKAVVLWLSDNPDLNRQSRYRIESASDELAGHTHEIENTFTGTTFTPGTIYFLNTGKIGKGTLLAGRNRAGAQEQQSLLPLRPDQVQVSIWDTIRNTINSPDHHLYMVVDEAHRGSAKRPENQATLLRKLVEGHTPEGHDTPVPPMPVVMGVSATPGAFKQMVSDIKGSRLTLEDVEVPVEQVQESGLVKDIIDLRIPGEEGKSFDNVLLRQAAGLLSESSQRWHEYYVSQGELEENKVAPLMVVQMKDKCTGDDMYEVIKAVRDGWPDLPYDCFAHVFGEHTDVAAGDMTVPYVEPQSVQDRTSIHVLFAKEAISTGWDCPRAEVMVSFRTAKDKDHITQVIGRMVRSPLARRIDGNDLLNSVLCVLPQFDRAAAKEVVKRINRQDGTTEPPVTVVVKPEVLNPIRNEDIWDIFTALPREVAPIRSTKPVSRLLNLGVELQRDGLKLGGEDAAQDELVAIVNGMLARHATQVSKNVSEIMKVETTRLRFDYGTRELMDKGKPIDLQADHRVVEEAYRTVTPVFTKTLAHLWVTSQYMREMELDENANEAEVLTTAQLTLAALGMVEGVGETIAREADDVATRWFDEQRANVATLPDSRQQKYQTILEMAQEPSSLMVEQPANRLVAPGVMGPKNELVPYPRMAGHLLVGADGLAPMKLNTWETQVLTAEQGRSGAAAWYRNPSRASADALTAAYFDRTEKRWRNVQPDFVFFRDIDGVIRPSIVDPHGGFLADSLYKLQGMALYAEKYGDLFVQIVSVDGDKDSLKAVDLKNARTRQVIADATTTAEVYATVGYDYQ